MSGHTILGIPKEGEVVRGIEEHRVGLSPAGVRDLVELGAEVFVASGAGGAAGFRNGEYRSAGAQVVYSNEEVIRRADIVIQIGRPAEAEWPFYNPGSTLFSFLILNLPAPRLMRMLVEKKMTSIGYEAVRLDDGTRPILRVSSEIAGKMAVQIAGRLLETTSGGKGVLLGGTPGIPPADVVILGGGTVGYFAARTFLGTGASVYILDNDLERLRELDELFQGRVVTAVSNQANIEKHVAFADVLLTCALVSGKPAPVLVSEKMVEQMYPGSVIIDFSIDQGGCVETSRLDTSENFLFNQHGVVHFCAPNIPAMVARTSSYGLTNALLPYLRRIVSDGLAETLKFDRSLCRGLYTFDGYLAGSLPEVGLPQMDLEQRISEMD